MAMPAASQPWYTVPPSSAYHAQPQQLAGQAATQPEDPSRLPSPELTPDEFAAEWVPRFNSQKLAVKEANRPEVYSPDELATLNDLDDDPADPDDDSLIRQISAIAASQKLLIAFGKAAKKANITSSDYTLHSFSRQDSITDMDDDDSVSGPPRSRPATGNPFNLAAALLAFVSTNCEFWEVRAAHSWPGEMVSARYIVEFRRHLNPVLRTWRIMDPRRQRLARGSLRGKAQKGRAATRGVSNAGVKRSKARHLKDDRTKKKKIMKEEKENVSSESEEDEREDEREEESDVADEESEDEDENVTGEEREDEDDIGTSEEQTGGLSESDG